MPNAPLPAAGQYSAASATSGPRPPQYTVRVKPFGLVLLAGIAGVFGLIGGFGGAYLMTRDASKPPAADATTPGSSAGSVNGPAPIGTAVRTQKTDKPSNTSPQSPGQSGWAPIQEKPEKQTKPDESGSPVAPPVYTPESRTEMPGERGKNP